MNDTSGALVLAKAPGDGFPAIPRLVEIADDQAQTRDLAAARATLSFALKEATDYVGKHPQDATNPPYDESPALADHRRGSPGRDRAVQQHANAAFVLARVLVRLGDIAGAQRVLESIHNDRWRVRPGDQILDSSSGPVTRRAVPNGIPATFSQASVWLAFKSCVRRSALKWTARP